MEFEKVRKVIAEQFNMNPNMINERTSFEDDLNADSLDVLQLTTALEEEFDMLFPNDSLKEIKTVADVVEYIKNVIAKA